MWEYRIFFWGENEGLKGMLLFIPVFTQKVANFPPEWVAGFLRNQWQV